MAASGRSLRVFMWRLWLQPGVINWLRKNFLALTEIVKALQISRSNQDLEYGFNEWLKAQDGQPMGQNWQTWSAALYLYAAKCVEERRTPFFDEIRNPQA